MIEATLPYLVGFYADSKKEMFVGSVVVQTFDGIEMLLRKMFANPNNDVGICISFVGKALPKMLMVRLPVLIFYYYNRAST